MLRRSYFFRCSIQFRCSVFRRSSRKLYLPEGMVGNLLKLPTNAHISWPLLVKKVSFPILPYLVKGQIYPFPFHFFAPLPPSISKLANTPATLKGPTGPLMIHNLKVLKISLQNRKCFKDQQLFERDSHQLSLAHCPPLFISSHILLSLEYGHLLIIVTHHLLWLNCVIIISNSRVQRLGTLLSWTQAI